MSIRIDMQNALAEMARLALEAGDWRNQPPFDAILNWHTDEVVHRGFIGHIQGCRFCLEAIEMLRPVESENEPRLGERALGRGRFTTDEVHVLKRA